MLQDLWKAHVVSAIAKLRIADSAGSRAKSAAELALETSAQHPQLQRLLRTGAALRRDASTGMHAVASLFTDQWHLQSWEKLAGMDLAFSVRWPMWWIWRG